MLDKHGGWGGRERLTPRESEIAELVLRGLGNKVIARQLELKVGTVKIHVHNIYRKLGVPNRRVFLCSTLTKGPNLQAEATDVLMAGGDQLDTDSAIAAAK